MRKRLLEQARQAGSSRPRGGARPRRRRRYRKYGYRHVYFDWIKNGFAVLLKNRSSDQVWEEVR
ncbi:MAG: hypothetical protein Q8922_10715 [Bacteroidota bacterium]|nr:hypothetical protein [Bacteroidota bacterium]MDP4233694.1 hypothetical protein [Bacteroidota bacterium]MDP4241849.1 hypothetical protein [Bacteroidota bacterium]MDP4288398.1 hypothetical protein [Bacteroidota bacterium]